MINPFIRLTLLIFILQTQFLSASNLHFRKLTVADGLSNNFIRSIHRDSRGFMWFGTLEGLDRYDGVEIRSYAHKFPTPHLRVNCIANDSSNHLWIGTEKGLLYWDYFSPMFENISLNVDDPAVTALLALPGDSLILAGTSTGISIVNITTFESQTIEINESEGPVRITGAVYDPAGHRVWISTSGALVEFRLDDFAITTYNNADPSAVFNNFSSITMIEDDIVLGTQTRGLFIFDKQLKTFRPFTNVGSNYILSLSYKSDGRLFIGTDGNGLVILDTQTGKINSCVQDISIPGSLNSNAVYSLHIEDSGRYWIGTYTGGVNYRSGRNDNFHVSIVENGVFIGENNIRSLYFDSLGTKYIGTDGNGLIVLDPLKGNRFFNNQLSQQMRSNVVLALGNFNDHIFVGTFRGGISLYDPSSGGLKKFRDEGAFQRGSIYGFDIDHNGNLWIGGLEGLSRINAQSGELRHFSEYTSGLVNNLLIALMHDSSGRIWTGSVSAGVVVYNPESDDIVPLVLDTDLSSHKAVSFYEDYSGNIWVPTEGSGLIEISRDLKQVNVFTTAEGLPSNLITAITEAPENVFWISTHKGLCRYDRNIGSFARYTLSDGLPSLVFNRNAVVNEYRNNGKLWFGSEKGLVSFYPDSLVGKKSNEKVVLTDLYVSGQKFLQKGVLFQQSPEIEIKGEQKSIGFRFVALNYHNPADNEYAYRLGGKNDEWQYTTDNMVTFSDLKPGSYTFEVFLTTGNTVEQAEISFLEIVVKPHFYQKTAFIALVVVVILAVLWFVISLFRKLRYRLHLLQLEHKNENLQVKGKENVRYVSSHLSSQRRKEIEMLLIKYIEENKSYLNADLKLSDLASMIDCSPHDISQVINQNLNQSFYEFINGYRIDAVKKCMHDTSYSKYTHVAIAQQCGFSSKTSFYRAFKKLTGQTPLEYQGQVKEESQDVM